MAKGTDTIATFCFAASSLVSWIYLSGLEESNQ